MIGMEQHSGSNQWRWQVVLIFLGILCVGFFLRSFHFSDWLHFELDQARDARVIDSAAEGSFFDLPLLGPKAGGTFLRLGPFFYVFQYVSGLVFGTDPVGYALGVMLLSTATIGVFFLLARRFFSDQLSLGLTALLSVSAYFVMYGRFAWNPNPLPFFILAGFYALLRSVDMHERRRGVWFGTCAALLGMASQLHFLAFITLPVLVAGFSYPATEVFMKRGSQHLDRRITISAGRVE
jgi:4-amino-4-deoxy-L-arabinose transferase-like glycosyltransferase